MKLRVGTGLLRQLQQECESPGRTPRLQGASRQFRSSALPANGVWAIQRRSDVRVDGMNSVTAAERS